MTVAAYLEGLELLENMPNDAGRRRLVRVSHCSPTRLGAERLAQTSNTTPGPKVHLTGDRGCKQICTVSYIHILGLVLFLMGQWIQ